MCLISRLSPRRDGRPPLRTLALLTLAAILALAAGNAGAYQRDFHFQRIDSSDGLAQNTIRVLFQDARGFVWLATQGGLHRYDGYTLRRYRHDPQRADSLSDNMVDALADAGNGRLWIGSKGGGLSLFDPDSDRVLPLPAAIAHPGLAVNALQPLADGRLLIATTQGIDRLDPAANAMSYTLHRIWTAPANEPVRGTDFAGQGIRVRGFARCPDGSAYAATVDGVLALGSDAGQTSVLLAPDTTALNAIQCDRAGNLLIGDRNGLQQLDRVHATLTSLWSSAAPAAVRGVTAIAQDHAGILWLAVPGTGLVRYDRARDQTRVLQPQPGLAGALPDTGVDKLLIDRSGLLWLGTWSSGAAYADPAGTPFHSVIDLTATRAPGSNHINALAQAADGSFWLSAGSGGLRHYDPRSDSFQDFDESLRRAVAQAPRAPQSDNGVPAVFVFALEETSPGQWLLATSRGLLQFDPARNNATTVGFADPQINALIEGGVRAMLRARNGDLWLAPLRQGLLQTRDGRLAHHYEYGPAQDGLADRSVLELMQDRTGQIWAGTANGVSLIDPDSGRVRSFREIPGRNDSLAGHTVASLHATADGTVWIGTQSGLNRLLWIDDAGAHFTRYGAGSGLPDDTIYCILDDARGDLWLATNLGIARLDPRTGAIRAFGSGDGLQGDEYNGNACLRTRGGGLLFGGTHGFDMLDPNAIRTSTFRAPVVITALRLDGMTQAMPIAGATTMEVPATARSLHINFAALDYAAPTRNRFRYRLLGEDDTWIEAGTRHSMSWTNFGAGDYRFEV
nr:hypothetical protein [Pseudomonadota bacterium]